MKSRAYVNFALIKYWGKKDEVLRLPFQASLSFTVDKMYTDTLVTYNKDLTKDVVIINGVKDDLTNSKRVIKHMDLIRKELNIKEYALIESKNYVPISAGLASSASSFAALSHAATINNNIKISNDELSRLSRLGSGSAARSIYGGFVLWQTGDDYTSVAKKLPITWDDFRIVVVVVSKDVKEISSSDAMEESVKNKDGYNNWISQSKIDLDEMILALKEKDIDKVGIVAERNSNHMHNIIESTGIKYKNEQSLDVIKKIEQLRLQGIKAYYTMDAGPNVKIITLKEYVTTIEDKFNDYETIICSAGNDVHLVD